MTDLNFSLAKDYKKGTKMRELYDLHVHTRYSVYDGNKSPENSITALSLIGKERGLSGAAFSDHYDTELIISGKQPLDCDAIAEECALAQEQVGNAFNVIHSVEIGSQMHYPDYCAENIKKYNYDMVLSSVHILKDKEDLILSLVDFEKLPESESRRLFELYMHDIMYTAKNCDFDSLTHITYILRYFKKHGVSHLANISDDMDIYDEVFKALIHRGKALEVNTSGLRQGHGETFPNIPLIKRYIKLGGELFTVGSDSHNPWDFGAGICETTDMLATLGVKYTCYYKNRKPIFIKL